jgi:hypothetical protein
VILSPDLQSQVRSRTANREPDEFDPEHLQAKARPGARARRDRVGEGVSPQAA